jgi:hypothetical protein
LLALSNLLKNQLVPVTLLMAVTAFYGCSAQPEGDGKPSLSCGKPAMPDSNFVIERLHSTTASTLSCGAFRGDLPGPELVQFRIYEIIQPGGNLPRSGGGDEEGGEGLQGEVVRVPKSGIAFYPYLGSHLVGSAARTSVEFQVDPSQCKPGEDSPNCVISPYQYLGVVTPSSEWCSDSTGIMSYEFWMSCNGASSSFGASVVSGAIKPDAAYEFSVTSTE